MIDLVFNEERHEYRLNGRIVPSVTDVLQPLLMLDGIPWATLEAARIFGGHVHLGCHYHNTGELEWTTLDDRLASYIRGYLKFLADTSFVVLASEERVASVKCGYAGTLDLRGMLRGRGKNPRRALIDIKSTATLPRTVGPQTAGYSNAYTEMTSEKVDDRYCLHLGPDEYKLVKLTDGRGVQDFTVFVSALNIHRFRSAQ